MDSDTKRITITVENPRSRECLLLIAQLTAELIERYGDDGGAGSFNPFEEPGHGSAFLIARFEGQPIGCGAIRMLAPDVAEVKRMYVMPEARGRGVARRILHELESAALELSYRRIRLETGQKQPEAIGLYESAGYHRIACYGIYVGNPLSVCFEKHLGNSDEDGEPGNASAHDAPQAST